MPASGAAELYGLSSNWDSCAAVLELHRLLQPGLSRYTLTQGRSQGVCWEVSFSYSFATGLINNQPPPQTSRADSLFCQVSLCWRIHAILVFLRKSQLCTDNLFPLYRACCIASNKCIYPELSCFAVACQVGLIRMLSVPWGYQVIQQLQQCSREDKELIMAFISWPWLLFMGGENVIKSLSFCLVKL